MALASSTLLRPQTALQQLLEEINFQRTKEMRQLLKDDGGFVVLQGTTYWTDLFVRHFLFQAEAEQNIDSDDLLFFVRKKHVKGSSRQMPKYETDVDVYRKDSRKLPIGDPDVDWEETVYLNLIIHQFNYTLTLAICTRTSPKELQVLRRHSQRVYASPSRRKMDTKGDGEEMTYPHICFMVDNFDEVFGDIMVRDGEMVCVELVANDRDGTVQGVIFLGSIRYDALKKVYDARQSSISTKLAQRMTFGLFSGGCPQTRCEFVRMKGPQGKGHAEMAVTKPKGSGVETPTSEPGFCATDMWDEWDEDPDDFLNYRHQRRLSDPSANLNNYSRYGWKTKVSGCGDQASKARSENEGLDSLSSEVSEIEAGDLKDDRRPASPVTSATNNTCASKNKFSSSILSQSRRLTTTTTNSTTPKISIKPTLARVASMTTSTTTTTAKTATCCNCFGPLKNQWSDSVSGQMSDVYCRVCDDEVDNVNNGGHNPIDNIDSPACLINVTVRKTNINGGCKPKQQSVLTIESELEIPRFNNKHSTSPPLLADRHCVAKGLSMGNRSRSKSDCVCVTSTNLKTNNNKTIGEEYELADDATICNGDGLAKKNVQINVMNEIDTKLMIRVQGKEELPASPEEQIQTEPKTSNNLGNNSNIGNSELFLSDRNIIRSKLKKLDIVQSESSCKDDRIACNDEKSGHNEKIDPICDCEKSIRRSSINCSISGGNSIIHIPNKINCTNDHPLLLDQKSHENLNELCNDQNEFDDFNGNSSLARASMLKRIHRMYSTLPKIKKSTALQQMLISQSRPLKKIPTRVTPDGTTIYYWCDLSKQALKELDDGAYNPLWTTKGFTQTFHFWKEHRRQQSTPLNAFLTYVTLPWWSIAKDLLDNRETPILTF